MGNIIVAWNPLVQALFAVCQGSFNDIEKVENFPAVELGQQELFESLTLGWGRLGPNILVRLRLDDNFLVMVFCEQEQRQVYIDIVGEIEGFDEKDPRWGDKLAEKKEFLKKLIKEAGITLLDLPEKSEEVNKRIMKLEETYGAQSLKESMSKADMGFRPLDELPPAIFISRRSLEL